MYRFGARRFDIVFAVVSGAPEHFPMTLLERRNSFYYYRHFVTLFFSYFDPAATQEILDEIKPLLCPFDAVAMRKAIMLSAMFLPVTSPPELADSTYKLWLPEFMRLWEVYSNSRNYDHVSATFLKPYEYHCHFAKCETNGLSAFNYLSSS